MTDSAVRVLFLTPSWPLGGVFGGQIRALHVARALRHVGAVRVVIVSSDAPDLEAQRATEREFVVLPPVQCHPAPNLSLAQKAQWALNPRYLNVHGSAASMPDRERIVRYCAEADLVWVHNARTPNVLQQWAWPKGHVDLDDIPSTYLRTLARHAESPSARLKTRAAELLFRRRECTFARRFVTLSVCSQEDRSYLGGGNRIHVIPNGFALPEMAPQRRLERPRIGFIGLGSFEPNKEGLRWFLRESWPSVLQELPDARFRLVGRGNDAIELHMHRNVDVLGEVRDPAPEIATWAAMVVPVRLGGGTRVKIAEAFSRKCPVVSTSVGAFGYEVHDRRHLRIADTPREVAEACVQMLRNPAEAGALAERAFELLLRSGRGTQSRRESGRRPKRAFGRAALGGDAERRETAAPMMSRSVDLVAQPPR